VNLGDRFYQTQLDRWGDCPGNKNPKRRKRSMSWTDEKKAEVVAAYEEAEPTAETSVEIVKQIAEDFEESPNGVRMILTKAGVYIKKAGGSSTGGSTEDKPASTRVSKAGAQEALAAAILAHTDVEAEDDVVSKLTGKAAVYFKSVLDVAVSKASSND